MHPGEQHGNSRLTEEEVLDIRQLYATGEWTQWELAEEFEVSKSCISQTVRRKRWRHV